MMRRTALASRSNSAAPAWPNQATGAVLPNGSARTFFKRLPLPIDAAVASQISSDLSPRSLKLTASDPFRFSHDIEPAINTHRPRAGQRFSPTHF